MTFPGDDPPWPERPRQDQESESQPDTDRYGARRRPWEARSHSEADLFAPDEEDAAIAGDGSMGWRDARDERSDASPAADVPFRWQSDTNYEYGRTGAARGSAAGGRRARRVAWELLQTLALAVLIFLMVRGVVQNFRVEGPSMEPGLHNGQYLLVNKAVYFKLDLGTLSKYIPFIDAEPGDERFIFQPPQRGDVIVFRYPRDPTRDFIKRVIGVPGDVVRIDADGTVYVNGVPLEESYVTDNSARPMEEQVVPPRNYFVLGDNRPNSSDSRNWGFVPEENIIGKAMLSYWPLNQFGGVGNTRIDLGFVRLALP